MDSQWQAAGRDVELAQERFEALRKAVDIYLSAASDDEPRRRLTCALKVVDAALSTSSPQTAIAATYLRAADALASQVPSGDAAAQEYHYRALQLARLQDDVVARGEHARWLVENAAGSRYELAALVSVATVLAAKINHAPTNERAELQRGLVISGDYVIG